MMASAGSGSDLQTMFSPSINDKTATTDRGGKQPATRKWKSKDPKKETLKALMYGMLISLIIVPVNISFAAIIFSDSFYQPHLPGLTKLVLAAGTIHQICFTMRSSLPFAIGQVTKTPHVY
jgi:SulP family sulfate permease